MVILVAALLLTRIHFLVLVGELRNGAKTKAGPLDHKPLSRFGNIALVRWPTRH